MGRDAHRGSRELLRAETSWVLHAYLQQVTEQKVGAYLKGS